MSRVSLLEFRRRSTVIGRADLVAACDDSALQAHIARQLGWSYHEPEVTTEDESLLEGVVDSELPLPSIPPPAIDSSAYPHGVVDIALWLPMSYRELQRLPEPPRPAADDCHWVDFPDAPKHKPLAPWSVLRSRLRSGHQPNAGGAIDLPRLISRLARRELVARFPRLPTRRWADRLTVVVDRSLRLIPCDFDQRIVGEHLRKELPAGRVDVLTGNHPQRLRRSVSKDSKSVEQRFGRQTSALPEAQDTPKASDTPEPGRDVLVLGDLGILATSTDAAAEWLAWGKRQRMRGCRLHALVPCQPDQIPVRLRSVFHIHCWPQHLVPSVRNPKQRQELVEKLLTFASPAIRVEPGLLRDLRSLLPEAKSDVSLEAAFWLSHRLISRHPEAATLDSDTVDELRPAFERLDGALRERILQLIRAWHLPLETGDRVWTAEYASLTEDSKRLLPSSDRKYAEQCIRQLDHERQLWQQRFGKEAAAFCFRRSAVFPDSAYRDAELGKTLSRWRHDYHPTEEVAAGIRDPRDLPEGELRTLAMHMEDTHISAAVSLPGKFSGLPPILKLRSTNGVIRVAESDEDQQPLDVFYVSAVSQAQPIRRPLPDGPRRCVSSDLEEVTFHRVTRPDWAVDFGRDRYGAFAAFEICGPGNKDLVRQYLRWIPPGQFLMGSPEDEQGRHDVEHQHSVTISQGVWMFDTPCTQQLWEAVTGTNPSYFPDPLRPVEQVTWDAVNDFARQLSSVTNNMTFALPTESQWEYACRAGTTTAIFSGPLDILGDHNAPALDPVAWYGGNCGVEYDHAKFHKASNWKDKQYDFDKAGTQRVQQKAPNPWGLFDMLGNVWEWCSDWYGDYAGAARVDPTGPPRGSSRVVRGGSWIYLARYVRSACRGGYSPGYRYYSLGFRLLSSAGREPSGMPSQ